MVLEGQLRAHAASEHRASGVVLFVRCEADGSTFRAVMRLFRGLRVSTAPGGSNAPSPQAPASSVTQLLSTKPGESPRAGLTLVLLGGATCETSAAMTKAMVFGPGRRLGDMLRRAGASVEVNN